MVLKIEKQQTTSLTHAVMCALDWGQITMSWMLSAKAFFDIQLKSS
jgi:hypothetical protein